VAKGFYSKVGGGQTLTPIAAKSAEPSAEIVEKVLHILAKLIHFRQ